MAKKRRGRPSLHLLRRNNENIANLKNRPFSENDLTICCGGRLVARGTIYPTQINTHGYAAVTCKRCIRTKEYKRNLITFELAYERNPDSWQKAWKTEGGNL